MHKMAVRPKKYGCILTNKGIKTTTFGYLNSTYYLIPVYTILTSISKNFKSLSMSRDRNSTKAFPFTIGVPNLDGTNTLKSNMIRVRKLLIICCPHYLLLRIQKHYTHSGKSMLIVQCSNCLISFLWGSIFYKTTTCTKKVFYTSSAKLITPKHQQK